MKKKLFAMLLSAVLMTAAVACGENTESANGDGAVTAAEEVTGDADTAEVSENQEQPSGDGVHFDPENHGLKKENLALTYSDIPESVVEEMKAFAEERANTFLQENSDVYTDVSELTYEGYNFTYQESTTQDGVDGNLVDYLFSVHCNKKDEDTGEVTERDVLIRVWIDYVHQVDEHTYSDADSRTYDHNYIEADIPLDSERLLTWYVISALKGKTGYTTELGDGLEKYAEYTRVETLDTFDEETFANLDAEMREVIATSIEEEASEDLEISEPEYFGSFLYTSDDMVGSVMMNYYTVVVNAPDGSVQDQTMYFYIRCNSVLMTVNGELMYDRPGNSHMNVEVLDSGYVMPAGDECHPESAQYEILLDYTDSLKEFIEE